MDANSLQGPEIICDNLSLAFGNTKVLENLKHANPKTKGGNIFKMSGNLDIIIDPLSCGGIPPRI